MAEEDCSAWPIFRALAHCLEWGLAVFVAFGVMRAAPGAGRGNWVVLVGRVLVV